MSPRVTVVIPSFNASEYAKRAVQSVLDQDVEGVVVLIVDDASQPEHATALDALALDERVSLLRHEVNQGCRPARRHGWEAAETDIVAFLDDDDRHLPGYLDACLAELDAHPEYGAIHTQYWWVQPDGERIRVLPKHGNSGRIYVRELEKGTVKNSTLMIRRSCLLELSGILEHYRTSGDLDIVLRLAYRHGFGFVERPLVEVTARPGSLSRDAPRNHTNRAEILENLLTVFPDMDASTRRATLRKAAKYFRKAARGAAKGGEKPRAKELYRKALGLHFSFRTLVGYLGSL